MNILHSRLFASRRFISRTFTLAITASGLLASTLSGATIDVTVDPADTIVFPDGTAISPASVNSRVGQGFVGYGTSVYVMPFQLPALSPSERIVSAKLSLNLEGWSNFSGFLRNLDLYGINVVSGTSKANFPENFVDGVNPGANPNAFLLQDNWFTPADINISYATGLTIPKVSQDFGWFLQALYDAGAQPGEYAFLTLTHDAQIAYQRYYLITAGNSTTLPKPKLTITTAPANPADRVYYLDAGNGDDSGSGSVIAPWKTFGRAQQTLIAGNTLRCTGELGAVTIKSTDPVGAPAVMSGTAVVTPERLITYTDWPGHAQPHITMLSFRDWTSLSGGTRIDRYLKFSNFRFAPGQVDSGGRSESNAVYLASAWHVTLDGCTVEGAELRVPEKQPGTNYGVDSARGFRPYTPTATPAVTAGYPGNASYVTINNCQVSDCAIGILVGESYSGKISEHWTITNTTVTGATEDGIQIDGGGASGDATAAAIIKGNTVSGQNEYHQAFLWRGDGDQTVWNNYKWHQVRQDHYTIVNGQSQYDGTYSTAVIYYAGDDIYSPTGPSGEPRMTLYLLADDHDHVTDRRKKDRWYLVENPSIYFDPTYVDGTTNTLVPTTGDSAHTDAISIMGPTHDVIFQDNRIEVSVTGSPLKLDNTGHSYDNPTYLIFENNLFYSTSIAGASMNIAGGEYIWFKHNVLFAGPGIPKSGTIPEQIAPPARVIRFIDQDHGFKFDADGTPHIYFYNNIIGGCGDTLKQDNRVLAVTKYNAWLSAPLPGKSEMQLGEGDFVVSGGWKAVLFHNAYQGELWLDPGSPVQNKGSALSEYQTSDNRDFTGYLRHDGMPDPGAYEIQTP